MKELLKRISRNPQADEIQIKREEQPKDDESLALRFYFVNRKDEEIVQIMENYFGAVRAAFPTEWNPPTAQEYILRKTVGFQALMTVFDSVWAKARSSSDASFKFFVEEAAAMKRHLGTRPLTSAEFPSSGSTATRLAKVLLGVD